jgi:hypothetical protein
MWEDLKDIREFRSTAVLLIVAVIGTIIASRTGHMRSDPTWTAAFMNSLPILSSLALYLLIHGSRAPWKLDLLRYKELQDIERKCSNLSAEVQELKPVVSFLAAGTEFEFSCGCLQTLRLANCNPRASCIADGLHGTVEYQHKTHNPITVEAIWIDEQQKIYRSVNLPGRGYHAFVFLIKCGNQYFIPDLGLSEEITRGRALVAGTPHTLMFCFEGSNFDKVLSRMKITADNNGGLVFDELWTTLPVAPVVP